MCNSTPERLFSITGTVAHIDRAVCSAAPEYTTSNGTMISQNQADELKDTGMYLIGLSLDGLEGTPNWFRRTLDGYQKVLDGFHYLKVLALNTYITNN